MAVQMLTLSRFDLLRLEPLLSNTMSGELPDYLQSLDLKLASCIDIPPAEVPADIVTMNSRVRLQAVDSQRSFDYELVFPSDADPTLGKVSVLTPIGAALLGARVGDIIDVSTPGNLRRLRIAALLFQPEAAGRFDL